jgi:outer membrane protein assembly factor BamB
MATDGVNGTHGRLTPRAGRLTTRALRSAAIAALATACVPFARDVPADGWPEARTYLSRPDRAPASAERVDTAPRELWKAKLGRGGTLGLPAVGERVVVLSTPDRWVYALDMRTGKLLWRRRGDAPYGAGPIVADGLIFTSGEGPYGRVTAARIGDGRRKWGLRIGDVTAPLTWADGTVYGVTTAGVAFAARAADGHLLWRREIGPARAAPVVLGARVAYVTITDTLATLDGKTGAIVERATLATSTTAAPTVLDDSTLVVADPAGGIFALAVPSGREQWRVATGLPVLGPAVIARDTAFALTTACTLWRVPLAAPATADSVAIPDCVTEAAPTVLRDGVLVASVRGELILFDPRERRRVFTRQVRGHLQHPALVLHGQIVVAPSLGEVVSFR